MTPEHSVTPCLLRTQVRSKQRGERQGRGVGSGQKLPQIPALLRDMGVATAQLQNEAIGRLRTRYPFI